jgi:hypothetical protein
MIRERGGQQQWREKMAWVILTVGENRLLVKINK